MSIVFRELLKKIGSGPHTGKNLTRQEAEAATEMMLLQEATPAQIGAFMIAHRIKRPTGEELAGMLDAYDRLGPKLSPLNTRQTVVVMGLPYDGRDRTFPLAPLTALILASAGCAVIQHGGDRMPTKEGIPLIQIWQALGVDWRQVSLTQVQDVLAKTGLGFIYLPDHFPLAQALVPYREQIGKRPPLATLELIWSPYGGPAHVMAGFVHPPTETFMQEAMRLRQTPHLTTIKGLEGSGDLPRERTAILGLGQPDGSWERLHLHPQDYGFAGRNVPLDTPDLLDSAMAAVLAGHPCELRHSVLWNSGFYLWQSGVCCDLRTGIETAATLLDQGQIQQKLTELQMVLTQTSHSSLIPFS